MKLLSRLILLTTLLTIPIIVMAQPPGLPGGGQEPSQVPIDGGLGFLAAAGGAYGLKKLWNRRKAGEGEET